jgi:Flp pilus assembly protein TadG
VRMPVQRRMPSAGRKRARGGAMMEMVLISPWIFFLFIGALDWGFYASALVSMQAAVRSAVLYTSASEGTAGDTDAACTIVLNEIRKLPNIGSSTTTCGSNPVVTATSLASGPGSVKASRVTVTYTSITLVPLPGLLRKQFTITRSAVMRLRSTT